MTSSQRVAPIVFQPKVYLKLQRGIHKMVDAVRPTFGPLHGTVMVQRIDKRMLPDILDDGGVIARRIIELSDRNEDVGAMMVRHLMWRIHERYGDATVTAALIYQSIFDQGVRFMLNGGNAMLLRGHLDKGAQMVMEALSKATIPVTNRDQISCLARTLCADEDIAAKLGETFMHIGRNGQLEIKPGRGRESTVDLINGMTWKGSFFVRSMIMDTFKNRSELEDCAILVSNLILDDPYELAEWLARISQGGVKRLLFLAHDISPDCLSVLEASRRAPDQFNVIAVKLWETSERWELQDLSILTGGVMFAREAGYRLANIKLEHLGHAAQVWVERDVFGVIDGAGNAEIIQRHGALMLMAMGRSRDEALKRKLQGRIAAFTAKSAVYWMGGSTQIEIEERTKTALRTANTLREAMTDGILPGGAIALIESLDVLEKMARAEDVHERAAGRMIINALKTPINSLIENCGEVPDDVLARIKRRGKGFGFEVYSRKVKNMMDAGVYDVANAVKAAAYAGITAAAIGLTVDVVVHPKKRKESFTTS